MGVIMVTINESLVNDLYTILDKFKELDSDKEFCDWLREFLKDDEYYGEDSDK